MDPTERKPREIDVVAERLPKPTPARIYAVVECKARTVGAWVVRHAELAWNNDLWSLISSPALAERLETLVHVINADLPLARPGEPIPFSVTEAVRDGDRDSAYTAISQAVSAARGWVQRAEVRSIALPVVIVDTPLFALAYPNGRVSRDSGTSSWADSWAPSRRTRDLHADGQLISLVGQPSGTTPFPAVASASRYEAPSVRTTWAWWRSRSTVAVARVLGMIVSKPDGWRLDVTATLRRS